MGGGLGSTWIVSTGARFVAPVLSLVSSKWEPSVALAVYGVIAVAVLAADVGRLAAPQRLVVAVRPQSFGVRSLPGVRSFGERPAGG